MIRLPTLAMIIKRAVKYSPILINVRTLYNAHVITSKYIAKI